MTVYFGLFFYALVISFFSLFRSFPVRPFIAIIFLSIYCVLALRYASVDYFSYLSIYEGLSDFSKLGIFFYSLNDLTPIESGFAFLILSEKIVFGDFYFFIFLFSILSIAVKYYAFTKLSPYVVLSILIYLSDEFFWKDLGQMRSAMAASLILASVVFAHRQEPWKFFLIVFLSLLFHSAAVLGFFIYFFRHLAKPFLMISILGASIFAASTGGLGLFIPEIALALGFDEASRLVKYQSSEYVKGISPFGGTFSLHVFMSSLMIFFSGSLIRKWPPNSILIPMYVYGTALIFFLIDYGIIAGRIRDIFCVPASVIVFPSFILLFRGRERLVPYFAILSYCFLWFYMMTSDREPYQSILQFI